VADLCIFGFNRVGVRLRPYVPVFGQDVVGTVMVGGVDFRFEVFEEQQLLQRLFTTRTDPEGKDVFGVSINCQPQPELAVFFPT
jgi:hypothetical protein